MMTNKREVLNTFAPEALWLMCYQHISYHLVLFNNREIQINGKSFYHNEWHQKGILSIQDVLSDDEKFPSYQEFLQTTIILNCASLPLK